MNSELKLKVSAKKMPDYGDKYWVFVEIRGETQWIPSFKDLFRIIQAICWCEDEKYPYGKGRRMVQEFVIDCCRAIDRSQLQVLWEELQVKYKIPQRGSEN